MSDDEMSQEETDQQGDAARIAVVWGIQSLLVFAIAGVSVAAVVALEVGQLGMLAVVLGVVLGIDAANRLVYTFDAAVAAGVVAVVGSVIYILAVGVGASVILDNGIAETVETDDAAADFASLTVPIVLVTAWSAVATASVCGVKR